MTSTLRPQEIIDFWFPDGPNPDPDKHIALWMWRMRGGANDKIIAKYTEATEQAAAKSTPLEMAYLDKGEFPHETDLNEALRGGD